MGYARKKSKKKRIKHLNAYSEKETMKEKEIRNIKMECSNCKLIIIRQDKKKTITHIYQRKRKREQMTSTSI